MESSQIQLDLTVFVEHLYELKCDFMFMQSTRKVHVPVYVFGSMCIS